MFKEKRFGCQPSKENGPGQDSMAGVCEGECMGRSPRDELLTLTRCHSCGFPRLCETLERWKSVCYREYNLKGIKEKFSVFSLS